MMHGIRRLVATIFWFAILLTTILLFCLGVSALVGQTPDSDDFVYEGGEVNKGVLLEERGLTADSEEVKFLAELHDVDADRALEIAKWMESAELAVAQVRSAYADTFAGSEFIHEGGEVRLEVWVAESGVAESEALRSLVPQSAIGSISVKKAQMSEREAIEKFESLAESDPEQFGVTSRDQLHGELDFKTGTFIPEDPEVLDSLELDGHNACTHGTGGWLEGGRLLRFGRNTESHFDRSDGCRPRTWQCTSGFAAKLGWDQGILTAGHCLGNYGLGRNISEMYGNGKELFVSLRVGKWDSTPDDDAGFARAVYASAEARGRIYLDYRHGWRKIRGLLPGPAPRDAVRCIKSAGPRDIGWPPDHSKGFRCGRVSVSNYCHWGFCRYTKVKNWRWNDFPRPGSSGGPWFNSGYAAGTHTDSVTDEGIYYRLGVARNALPGLDIYCGGTSEYLCNWP